MDNSNGEVEIRQLVRIFIDKKWWFIYTFIAVFLAGFILSMMFTPKYEMEGQLVVNNDYSYYNDFLMENFPEQASNLVLYPKDRTWPEEFLFLESIGKEILSDDFLEELTSKLEYDINKEKLKELMHTETKEQVGPMTLNVVYKDKDAAFDITKNAIELSTTKTKQRLSQAYQELMAELEKKESEISLEIEELSKRQEKSQLENRELDSKMAFHDNITQIKTVLAENEDFFVNRVKLVKELYKGDVRLYMSRQRFIVFSLFAAIALGLIMVYLVNFLQSFKKK